MDLADIKRQALAAREFSLTVGGTRHITLRAPTQHEIVLAARRAGLHLLDEDAAAQVLLQRSLLLLAVVSWAAVLLADVLPAHEPAPDLLPFEPGSGNFTKIVQRVPVRLKLDPGQPEVKRLRPGLSATRR